MGRVKQALLELEDFVTSCIRDNRTLNQTIRDARESKLSLDNPYFIDEDLVENKYYQFKGVM